MARAVLNQKVSVNGIKTEVEITVDSDNYVESAPLTPLQVAKTSQLTTRTSATAGVLTSTTTPNVTSSDILGMSWLESGVRKFRYGVTISSVVGNLITFTGGSGDNLPTLNTTGIVYNKKHQENLSVTGDWANWKAFQLQGSGDFFALFNFLNSGSPSSSLVYNPTDFPLHYVSGQDRSGESGPTFGIIWTGATNLSTIDFYSLDIAATNKVAARILTN